MNLPDCFVRTVESLSGQFLIVEFKRPLDNRELIPHSVNQEKNHRPQFNYCDLRRFRRYIMYYAHGQPCIAESIFLPLEDAKCCIVNDVNAVKDNPLWRSHVLLINLMDQIVCRRLEEEMQKDEIMIPPRHAWVLMTATGLMGQSEVAKLLGINANVMVRVVDDLESTGLVVRDTSGNRRVNRICVTAEGSKLLARMYRGWEARTERIFHPLSMEEIQKISDLAKILVIDHHTKK